MAASPVIRGKSQLELVYIILYRLRVMEKEDKHYWIKKWAEIKQNLPKGIKIITEAGNAFGTEFTGFTVFEGPFDKFEKLVSILEEHSGDLFEKTKTVIGTKGLVLPSSQVQKILKRRPID
ncbi:MAG: hypothetical protein ACTSUB_06060 [Candidatus Thorarchaeota archaeon]